jgi:hypothetical protein
MSQKVQTGTPESNFTVKHPIKLLQTFVVTNYPFGQSQLIESLDLEKVYKHYKHPAELSLLQYCTNEQNSFYWIEI